MSTAKPLSRRRRQLLEAAVEVLAEHGLRGLTHRAVDRQAALPEGSCSAYLRTRRSLVHSVARFVAERLTEDVRRLSSTLAVHAGEDITPALDTTRGLFLGWLNSPATLVAKLELTLEASRDADLAQVFEEWRADLITLVTEILDAGGRTQSATKAEALVAALDGVLMGALLQDEAVRADYLTACLGALLGPVVEEARS